MTDKWFDTGELNKTGAKWRIAYGQRSDGKTMCGTVKEGIQHFLRTGETFVYLRRYSEDIKSGKMNTFFSKVNDFIDQVTGEKFDLETVCAKIYPQFHDFFLQAKSYEFVLYGFDDSDEKTRIDVIGWYHSLNQNEHLKSVNFPDCSRIIYDEFMTRGIELHDEFAKLLNFVSTVKRDREDFVVYLFANSVTRNSAILSGMNINSRDIQQGDIKCFQYCDEDGEVVNTVAVQYIETMKQSKKSTGIFSFGGTPKEMMIIKGEWETELYENFTENEFYSNRFVNAFVFASDNFRLYGYVSENGILYISDKREISRIDYVTLSLNATNISRKVFNFNCGFPSIETLKRRIFSAIDNGFVKYKNNLIGDDFMHFIDTGLKK